MFEIKFDREREREVGMEELKEGGETEVQVRWSCYS